MLKCTDVLNKLLELSYILEKKKKYVCIQRSFLVINVCNQGKNLCPPCIIKKEHILETWRLPVFRHVRAESLQEVGQTATAILCHWISDHQCDTSSSGPFTSSFDHLMFVLLGLIFYLPYINQLPNLM